MKWSFGKLSANNKIIYHNYLNPSGAKLACGKSQFKFWRESVPTQRNQFYICYHSLEHIPYKLIRTYSF